MKAFILLVFQFAVPIYALANDSFSDYFEYQSSFMPKHADKITQFFTKSDTLSSKQRLTAFKRFNDDISIQIEANPQKAILWFTKGLNFKNRLLALEQQKVLGARNIDKVILQTKEYMQKSFLKAMQLDNLKRQKLSARMYGTMKHNLNSNDRIKALQNELSLGGSGDNETNYWFSHWDIIGSLQDEGRLDDAEKALNTMQRELKVSGLEQSEFSQIYQNAKRKLENEHTITPIKDNASLAKKNIKDSAINPLFESIKSKFEAYWLMIIINLFVFISLIFAFIKRDKD